MSKQNLEEMGKLQFSVHKASILSGVKLETLSDTNSTEYMDYERGRLEGQVMIRRETYLLVNDGNMTAIKELAQWAKDSEPEFEEE